MFALWLFAYDNVDDHRDAVNDLVSTNQLNSASSCATVGSWSLRTATAGTIAAVRQYTRSESPREIPVSQSAVATSGVGLQCWNRQATACLVQPNRPCTNQSVESMFATKNARRHKKAWAVSISSVGNRTITSNAITEIRRSDETKWSNGHADQQRNRRSVNPIIYIRRTGRITRSARVINHFKNDDSPTRRASDCYPSFSALRGA